MLRCERVFILSLFDSESGPGVSFSLSHAKRWDWDSNIYDYRTEIKDKGTQVKAVGETKCYHSFSIVIEQVGQIELQLKLWPLASGPRP